MYHQEAEPRQAGAQPVPWRRAGTTSMAVHELMMPDNTPEVPALLPAENMALMVALAQIERGDEVPPNTTAVLVFALARICGRTL